MQTLTEANATDKQRQNALLRLAKVNPQAAQGVQQIIAQGDAAAIDAIRQETENGARQAKLIKSRGTYRERQAALHDLAASMAAEGKDISRLVELSNMSEGQLDVELDKMLLQATDINTITAQPDSFTLSEGETRFGPGGQAIASVAPEAAEAFEDVKNDAGQTVAQRSTKTNKLFPVPETAKSKKPKFENFVDADGELVTFDTNSPEGAALAQEMVEAGGRKALNTDAVPTVDQGKNAGFAIRSESASDIIDELGTQFSDFTEVGQRLLPNAVKSAERQQFEQAERNLINSVLRKESGAVISEEEFANARQQYVPQPGDSQEVLAQKSANRRQIIAGMRASAGKGALRSARSELGKLEGEATQAAPSQTFSEGQTATNPTTGETITFRNGQWQ